MQSIEEVLSRINPDLLRLQKKWWISFLFGCSPQRPYESYDILIEVAGNLQLSARMYQVLQLLLPQIVTWVPRQVSTAEHHAQ